MPRTASAPGPILPSRRREQELWAHGFHRVAGVDEAGVGPLAGPVVAAAAVLPPDFDATGVRDSKLIDAGERQILEQRILAGSLAAAVGIASVREIDTLGIYRATALAMWRAVDGLSFAPAFLLVDARQVAVDLPQEGPTKGDRDHTCIAAASILAKQHRDRLMIDLHARFPDYGFDEHKGYPTKRHFDAISKHGVSPVHRVSWLAVREAAGRLSDLYYELSACIRAVDGSSACAELHHQLSAVRQHLDEDEYGRLRELLRRRAAQA
jgi:ribonuclease HII